MQKVSKKDAVRAWTQLPAPAALLPRMLAALEWQRPGWTDPAYVPHPATWLKSRRWEDERPPPRARARTTPTGTRPVPSAGWRSLHGAGRVRALAALSDRAVLSHAGPVEPAARVAAHAWVAVHVL